MINRLIFSKPRKPPMLFWLFLGMLFGGAVVYYLSLF